MNGRQKSRLRRAREQGYLDARCPENLELLQAFGMWCWRLKLPMVWIERRTRYSRFARVRLDMFTSANCLTAAGQEYLKFLSAMGSGVNSARVSAHDAIWDRVEPVRARESARTVLRTALKERTSNAMRCDRKRAPRWPDPVKLSGRNGWKTGRAQVETGMGQGLEIGNCRFRHEKSRRARGHGGTEQTGTWARATYSRRLGSLI